MAEMTMQTCIELLGKQNEYCITGTSSNNICPMCGDPMHPRKKKLNINFKKNVFRCNKCGWSGGPLQFWALYRGLPENDLKAIGIDFNKCYEGTYGSDIARNAPAPVVYQEVEVPMASIDKVDTVYRALLGELYLSDKHRDDLLGRGLPFDEIEKGLYRTYPKNMDKIINDLIKKGIDPEGVPGFYMEHGKWKFVDYGPGFLIPSVNIKNKIWGLQLRKDTVRAGDTRYFTISSADKEKGTRGQALPSYHENKIKSSIILTEGPLKGNIISYFTGYSTLAVLGVNSLNKLPNMLWKLKNRGASEIIIAYDMDMYDKKEVDAAYQKLQSIIAKIGFSYKTLRWNPDFKGLDDYLAEKNK